MLLLRKSYRPARAAAPILCAAIFALGWASTVDAKAKYVTITINDYGVVPTGINTKGYIAGSYSSATENGGFLRAPDGTVTTFALPDAIYSFIMGINGEDEISGYYETESAQHGFVRTPDGTITSFDPSGSVATFVGGINNKGAVTGGWFDSNYNQHGFVRTADGTITSFDPQGSVGTQGYAINSDGAVAGTGATRDNNVFAFVRSAKGKITTFRCGSDTYGLSMNRTGTIAGYCFANDGFHGYVRATDGTITMFDPPDSNGNTFGGYINDAGVITGYYNDSAGKSHGFIRNASGKFTEFDVPGDPGGYPNGTFPSALNDSVAIVGTYTGAGTLGFLRTK